MKGLQIFTFVLLVLCVNTTNAQWFDAKGRAPIINGDKDIARNMAVQDAIKHALLFTGAQVQSISQLSNGLLSSDRFEVRSSGSVRSLQLISEDSANDLMVVHIRADIVASKSACHASNTTKLVALTKFPLRHRQQAVIGGIFNIGSNVAQQLFDSMSSYQGSFKASQLLPVSQILLDRNQPFSSDDSQTSPQQLLSAQADSQYLLTGEVQDISLAKPTSKWLGLSSNAPVRQFIASYTLYDGISGEKVWQKSYRAQGPWELEKTQQISTATYSFWSSVYGESIKHQLSQVTSDLNSFLQCQNLKGYIIRVDNSNVTVNLGKRHGLAIGDELSVYHATNFTDNRGILRQSTQINPTTLIVKNLYDNHLQAIAKEGELYGDIQHDAIVSLKAKQQ